jgi:hypothetical protein
MHLTTDCSIAGRLKMPARRCDCCALSLAGALLFDETCCFCDRFFSIRQDHRNDNPGLNGVFKPAAGICVSPLRGSQVTTSMTLFSLPKQFGHLSVLWGSLYHSPSTQKRYS